MEQREKLGNLEIQNINKELQVKTEVINEQLNVISMKDDKIAMQKLELEKAKEGTCTRYTVNWPCHNLIHILFLIYLPVTDIYFQNCYFCADIVEINQQKASLEVEKQLLESALVTLQDKLNAKTGEKKMHYIFSVFRKFMNHSFKCILTLSNDCRIMLQRRETMSLSL